MANTSIKFTRAAIDKIEPVPGKQILIWDSELRGFGLRVSPGGAKAYIMQRRVNGQERRVTIGRADDITAEAARKRAVGLAAQILDGKDPVIEKRRQKARSITLREAFADYIAAPKKKGDGRGSSKKPRTIVDIKNVMRYFEDWLDLPASDVTGTMVKKRHAELVLRSPAQANLAARYLRAAFNHLMADDDEDDPIIKRNPVDRLNRLNQWAEVKRATGHIPDERMAEWIGAIDAAVADMRAGSDVKAALLFMLLTGARVGEALGDPYVNYPPLVWNDVDLDKGIVVLRNTKNRSDHELPLGRELNAMLKARKSCARGDWVFGPATPHMARRALAKIGEATGIVVTPHDLRRTYASVASKLDINAFKLKRLTNHAAGGDVTDGYIRLSTEDLRDAMQRIEDFILSPARTSDDKVFRLRAAR